MSIWCRPVDFDAFGVFSMLFDLKLCSSLSLLDSTPKNECLNQIDFFCIIRNINWLVCKNAMSVKRLKHAVIPFLFKLVVKVLNKIRQKFQLTLSILIWLHRRIQEFLKGGIQHLVLRMRQEKLMAHCKGPQIAVFHRLTCPYQWKNLERDVKQ
jgi:hypothetical protein